MDAPVECQPTTPIELTAEIIAAYVSGNHIQASELTALIASVHAALTGLSSGATAEPSGPENATPAQIKKSISGDSLISFEDGKPYKTLRRHLTLRGLTPETYRAKWGLANDYPMTSASYSAQRSQLAHALGLGQKRRTPAPEPVGAPAETPAAAPKTRGRKKAAQPV